MSDFDRLTPAQQYEYLQRLRLVIIALTLGDDDIFFRLTGTAIDSVQANDSSLPDGADLADAVASWLGGAA